MQTLRLLQRARGDVELGRRVPRDLRIGLRGTVGGARLLQCVIRARRRGACDEQHDRRDQSLHRHHSQSGASQ